MVKKIRLDELSLSDLDSSPEHIALLREEVARAGRRFRRLAGFLHTLETEAGIEPTSVIGALPPVLRRPPRQMTGDPPASRTKPAEFHAGSWADVIYSTLVEAGRPLTIDEMKAALSKTPLAAKMAADDGSGLRTYYSTVQRLKADGHVVYHNGALTTPGVRERFLADVAAGRAVDVQHVRYRNRYAEEIYRFLKTKPEGATTKEIAEHVRSIPGLAPTGAPKYQKNYVVITINKLVYQSKSVKRLERGFYILTEFAEPKSGEKDAAENAPSIENERATEGNTPSVARH